MWSVCVTWLWLGLGGDEWGGGSSLGFVEEGLVRLGGGYRNGGKVVLEVGGEVFVFFDRGRVGSGFSSRIL